MFTATFSTSFITEDLAILSRHHNVTAVISSGFGTVFRFVSAILKNDITFSWFASVYSSVLVFFGKLFGKRSIVILGGVDVAQMPELDYGIWNHPLKSVIVRYGIRNADVVLAVDPSVKLEAQQRAEYDGRNIAILPTGHDHRFWKRDSEKKEHFVLTVANCTTYPRFRIKGIDFLYEVARTMPSTKFVLVGLSGQLMEQFNPPENIECHEFLPREKVLEVYRNAKVYFQPSMREAFGSSLCEAMLCDCYPVGTNVGGIPTVIGDLGSIVSFGDVHAATSSIEKGMKSETTSARRERIITHFSLELRERGLTNAIQTLIEHESA